MLFRSILNGDVVQSLSLLSSGAPARYGGRTGAVLSVRTREGNREEFHGRAGLSASGLLATLEGPLGRAKRTSWLVSARKSYADYVLDRIADNPGMVLGYYDATAKLAHQLTASNTLSLLLLHGRSRWRSTEADIDADDLYDADAETDLASLEWSFLPSARSRLEAGVSFLRETGDNRALDGTDLHRSTGTQWALRADATHASGRHRLEAGFLARGVAEAALGRRYDRLARDYRTTVDYDAGGAHWGAYLQDTWTGLDRLSLTLGARFERYAGIAESRFLPRASLSFTLSHRTRAVAAYGSYAQPPGFAQLHGENGNPNLSAEGSRHLSVALERQLSDTFRMRLEAYDLRHSGLFFSRETEWRVEDGRVVPPRRRATLGNALAGSSRGLELLLQRRSSDGLAGWIAYSLGHARRREQGGGLGFDADFDQRHTLTLHASQRLSRTLSLSTKYRYGSGFPVAGFYGADAAGTLLASERNAFRPAAYSRWDARIDKAFLFDGWKLTLYGEVINLLNRTQRRYTGLGSVDSRTRRVSLNDDTLLPLLPSAGLALEF